ncbi:uncharacterized protein LOC132697845 isoform X2 [Cylas formicarius]|uniref:uncharacterized protein LOC132697845 isoform X2 n=1 Tax=Cylas formicarius TaxID=197179 RepID=UPI002958778F|nr:uncharacterized protein LOC132697845 isoform X2 [Cylas formicarius]
MARGDAGQQGTQSYPIKQVAVDPPTSSAKQHTSSSRASSSTQTNITDGSTPVYQPSRSDIGNEPPPAYEPPELEQLAGRVPPYEPPQFQQQTSLAEMTSTGYLTEVTVTTPTEREQSIELTTISSATGDVPSSQPARPQPDLVAYQQLAVLPAPEPQPDPVTYHQIPVRPGNSIGPCPVCQGTNWVAFYPLSAWLFAIFLFPLGILFCLFMQRRECLKCGLQMPDHTCL